MHRKKRNTPIPTMSNQSTPNIHEYVCLQLNLLYVKMNGHIQNIELPMAAHLPLLILIRKSLCDQKKRASSRSSANFARCSSFARCSPLSSSSSAFQRSLLQDDPRPVLLICTAALGSKSAAQPSLQAAEYVEQNSTESDTGDEAHQTLFSALLSA